MTMTIAVHSEQVSSNPLMFVSSSRAVEICSRSRGTDRGCQAAALPPPDSVVPIVVEHYDSTTTTAGSSSSRQSRPTSVSLSPNHPSPRPTAAATSSPFTNPVPSSSPAAPPALIEPDTEVTCIDGDGEPLASGLPSSSPLEAPSCKRNHSASFQLRGWQQKKAKCRGSVRFSDPPVVSVRTRPRTTAEDKHVLHYSFEDMEYFREEYYRHCDRMRDDPSSDEEDVSSFDGDDESWEERGDYNDDESLEDMMAQDGGSPATGSTSSNFERVHVISEEREDYPMTLTAEAMTAKGHDVISKVMVVHQDVKKTYVVPDTVEDANAFFDNSDFWNGTLTYY